jgi:hypothetical protein
MSLSETISTAVVETCLPERCKACQRKGLPILLLRKAMVPDAVTQFHDPLNGEVSIAPHRRRNGRISTPN